ncbi:GAF domain-containing protein [Alcanivorax sp.]|uniref:GAF domain-containing protein n=1 Tax=Alcanivorax sp. TaxID=1872427 RepID=UPI002B26B8FE|nr:GAF domain-containing protein [Alcanivorax sp.]
MPANRTDISLASYSSCQELLDAHLAQLQNRFGMALWMITRLRTDELVVLRSRDNYYGLDQGNRLQWEQSYCAKMMELGAPRIAANAQLNPDYSHAPINSDLTIGAYIGLPLVDRDNQLFGTLCALDPEPQNPALEQALPALQHEARLISFLLANALRDAQQQRISIFVEHPDRCPQTGLPGPQGWADITNEEQQHCRDFGTESCVLFLHAPEDSDSLMIADSLAALLREQDSVAHLGNNHFGILLADADTSKAEKVIHRVRDALNAKQLLVQIEQQTLSAL